MANLFGSPTVHGSGEVCPRCGGSLGRQKAIVAFSSVRNNALVVASTKHLQCDLDEAGVDAGDMFDVEGCAGLSVWEGRIVYDHTPDSPNGPAEWDVDYVGKFRPLLDAEWDLLRSGVTELEDEKGE